MQRLIPKELLRGVAVVSAATVVLHQLRYLLGYGSGSGTVLAEHGHNYLTGALPRIAGVIVLLTVASLASSLIAAHKRHDLPKPGWMAWSVMILTVYSAQEMTEGVLAAGHPSGVAALSAGNGWLALPIALVLGAVVARLWAWLDHAEDLIVAFVASRREAPQRAPRRLGHSSLSRTQPATIPSGLAFGFSRRPPPLAS